MKHAVQPSVLAISNLVGVRAEVRVRVKVKVRVRMRVKGRARARVGVGARARARVGVGHLSLLRVDVDADDVRGADRLARLDHGEAHRAQSEDGHRRAVLDLCSGWG